ncbi:MAG: hypothetical protein HY000_16535 [Planctomycetes bacterium]|nr:hypothetical protein [Planctomycetota bacterium]
MSGFARLTGCLLAVLGISVACVFPSVAPAVRLSSWAESESPPAEERESSTAESTSIEHLMRCDGRRLIWRPMATASSLLPLPAAQLGRTSSFQHDCPRTEHALRDGLGAPLRI